MTNSFSTQTQLTVNGESYTIWSLSELGKSYDLSRLPFAHKILLENLLRNEDGENITRDDIEALCDWDPAAQPATEIAFTPTRVVLQDFTGVPAVVDFAAMRDAVVALGGTASQINPLCPVELVIDHSVQVDSFGTADSVEKNMEIEYQRNQERYAFLRWGQTAFENFQVVPPGTGIVHQVNLEYLAQVVSGREVDGRLCAFPDTVVGTDSHTTMINGIGVLGWGVGGIEAEAAMLGQPISMLIPQVVGFRLTGSLPEGTTATDLVLVVVQMLREKGVVGKFVEFFGAGLKNLPLSDRATLANMAPEYGATCGIFPVDDEVLRYLRLSGRDESQVELVESYYREQNMFHTAETPEASYSDVLSLDIGTIEPCISGPKRPQDRILLRMAKEQYAKDVDIIAPGRETANSEDVTDGEARFELKDGAIVIAAITSCTNTSNPAVMLAAGMLARNAVQLGLKVKPWVKTSLAPGSRVVTDYLDKADVLDDLETLGFSVVGYGCTTCIGNSGPLSPAIEQAIQSGDLVATSVLSGNRNFEGRIHARVKMNYLASPPLVVAYALAGRMDIDLVNDALGEDTDGNPVHLRDIWPSSHEIHAAVASKLDSSMFRRGYDGVFTGDQRWQDIESPEGERFSWASDSTYIRNPPYFAAMSMALTVVEDIHSARCLALLGDSITTDHISPAGAISPDSPAASYLQENGVERANFNSYGSRRGNHEVMMRGTFANIRLRNQLAPGTEGGWTRYQPDGEQMSIYDASMSYQSAGTPLLVIAGSEYGTGSSRDWAAKGTKLLGVSAVLCTSFERIHRSNLVGMGVLPMTFKAGEDATTLGLDGTESFDITGLDNASAQELTVSATNAAGEKKEFKVNLRLDTPKERDYVRHGGILHYVLRQLAAE